MKAKIIQTEIEETLKKYVFSYSLRFRQTVANHCKLNAFYGPLVLLHDRGCAQNTCLKSLP